jgi:hypothetical protein
MARLVTAPYRRTIRLLLTPAYAGAVGPITFRDHQLTTGRQPILLSCASLGATLGRAM